MIVDGVPKKQCWKITESSTILRRLFTARHIGTSISSKYSELERVFSSDEYWKKKYLNHSSVASGLFDHPLLKEPAGILELCMSIKKELRGFLKCINSSHNIYKRYRSSQPPKNVIGEFKRTIQRLDHMQDLLGIGLDLCKFIMTIRSETNPWGKSAAKAISVLSREAITLNTDPSLRSAISELLGSPTLVSTMVAQEKRTGEYFLKELGDCEVNLLGKLAHYQREANEAENKLYKVREHHAEVFESLMKTRYDMARLIGKESYAHLYTGKACGTPSMVISLIAKLLEANMSLYEFSINGQPSKIRDRVMAINDKNSERKLHKKGDIPHLRSQLTPYLNIGSVFRALAWLFETAFDLHLSPVRVKKGEIWGSGVRKLSVTKGGEGHVATIYCDIHSSSSTPACHVLQYSRRIMWEDHESFSLCKDELSSAAHDKGYRPVIIAITLNLPRRFYDNQWITVEDMEFIFHEFGHALQIIMSSSEYSYLSRGVYAKDFSEFTSMLFEYFARNPYIIAIASGSEHPNTLPYLNSKDPLDNPHRKPLSSVLVNYNQIYTCTAMFDQLCHSSLFNDKGDNTTCPDSGEFVNELIQELRGNFLSSLLYSMLCPNVRPSHQKNTSTCTTIPFFTLLTYAVAYKSFYYTYIVSRALAREVYFNLFYENSLSRDNTKLRQAGLSFQERFFSYKEMRLKIYDEFFDNMVNDMSVDHGALRAMGYDERELII